MSVVPRKNFPHDCDPLCAQCRSRISHGLPRFDVEPVKPPLASADARAEVDRILPAEAKVTEINTPPALVARVFRTQLSHPHVKRGTLGRKDIQPVSCYGIALVEISVDGRSCEIVCADCGTRISRGTAS